MGTQRNAQSTGKTRRYDSELRRRRAVETRTAILEAATRLFSERGWSVGMREVAQSAGVAVETVYANVGSKVALLNHVLDVAVVGDDEPVALMDRPEFAALGVGSRADRTHAAASLNAAINRRIAGLQRALREGAVVEPELAARLSDTRDRQRMTVQLAGGMVTGRTLSDTVADGVWAVLSLEVYELLTGGAGWSPERYEEWLTEALTKLLDIDM